MQAWDDLNAEAAALGVSVNFSTGDNGDFYRAVGAYTVSVPSNSPHATAVGGVSVFLNADYSIQFQTGWGTTITRIAEPNGTNAPDIPPLCASYPAARTVLLLRRRRRHEPVLRQTGVAERSAGHRTPAA